jgi:hypothetical protein
LVSQGTTTPILMTEAAFAPDGRLFVVESGSPHRVFTVDLSTGGLTLVGTPASATLASGLEFSENGTLYTSFASLYTVNDSDLSTISALGSTGGVYISKLTLGSGGILYGLNVYPSTHIYTLNMNTGQSAIVTAVTSTGLASLVAERTPAVFPAAPMQSTVINERLSYQDIESLLNGK